MHVFDISQTDGEPLEALDTVRPELLSGSAPKGVWDGLMRQAVSAGFNVVRKRRRGENGYCDFAAKEIGVRPDVEDAQAVKTLVHELGHALLHGEHLPASREVAEVEVESVAFVVLSSLGIDSGSYSFPYVAHWSGGEIATANQTGSRVTACASRILAGLSATSHLTARGSSA